MLKLRCLLFLFVLSLGVKAQFVSALIGVDGLTCSACSFATQKSILKLDFVDTVVMDLNTTIAKVTFKKGKAISIDALAKKVEDAGFSVRSIQGIYDFSNVIASENSCCTTENGVFQFIGISTSRTLGSSTVIRFIGPNYCSKREYKKWSDKIKAAHACDGGDKNAPHYFVTL